MSHVFVATQRGWMRAAIALLAFAALSIPAYGAREARLVDQRGHVFTFSQLHGTPLVVTFVAAHCTDICPLVNSQTARAVAQARASHLRIRFITITLDPEHDSLADMRHLAHVFGADPHSWIVADGSIDDVHAIMQAFHVTAEQGQRGYADVHTTFVYLIDTHGIIRNTMLASNQFDRQVIAEIRSNWGTLTQ